jgi:hypothetical protein
VVRRQSDIDSRQKLFGIPLFPDWDTEKYGKSIYKYICYIIFIPIYYYIYGAQFNGEFENFYDYEVTYLDGEGMHFNKIFVDLFKFLHIPEYIGNPVLNIFFGIFVTSFVTLIAAVFPVIILSIILDVLEKLKK